MLRIKFRHKPRKISRADPKAEAGPEARISKMRKLVTALVRHERIESKRQYIDESRGYAERLIYLASAKGPQDKEMMEIADYWLLEKDLIPKLFEVLVPRYEDHRGSYTSMHNLPSTYPAHFNTHSNALLELKKNPWPPVRPKHENLESTLLNVLLREAKKDENEKKYQAYKKAQDEKNMKENEINLKSESGSDEGTDVDAIHSEGTDVEELSSELKEPGPVKDDSNR